MNNLTVETENSLSSLLELAANNDLEGFNKILEKDHLSIDEVGSWYGREKESKRMVKEQRTTLMVAATYGSVDIIQCILSHCGVDVNRTCGSDKTTALHCAASGGAINAVEVAKLLLDAGADRSLVDANGHRPVDVIAVPLKLHDVRSTLNELLATEGKRDLMVSTAKPDSNSPNGSPSAIDTLSVLPVMMQEVNDLPVYAASEKKEYPIGPSLPDINKSIYSADEFRMYSFKVQPCFRAGRHDWTKCPFVHPGEYARRRDPRNYHYSCVPCPDFRNGGCRRGDTCEYAHGVFECWLHPAQYKTSLCKFGTKCKRRVCFFAHTHEDLRPSYGSTGSDAPSPRSSAPSTTAMDFAAAMSMRPGSPSSLEVMSPSTFNPPISPSTDGMSHSWSQANVPPLQLPASNLQSSRLRSSLNARDIPTKDHDKLSDFEWQQRYMNELSYLCQFSPYNLNRSGRMKSLAQSNFDDLVTRESSSTRYTDQALASAVLSPTHKSAAFNHFQQQQQQQQQSMLSPISSNFSPRTVDHPLLQASYGIPSPGRMSLRSVEPVPPASQVLTHAEREQGQQFRGQSSRELGYNSAAIMGPSVNSWSKWGSSDGKPDWTVEPEEFGKLHRSSSFELANNEEGPDISWVQSLVQEFPSDMKEKEDPSVSGIAAAASNEGSSNIGQTEPPDHAALRSWLEKIPLDPAVARQNRDDFPESYRS